MPAPHIAPGVTTSRSYTIKGQRSRWLYPHERLDPESTQTLTNINLSERGAAEVRKGYTTYNSTQLSGGEAVTGRIQANWKGTGLKQLVVTPTKVYIDDGTTRTNVTGSLSLTAGGNEDRIRLAFIRDKVVATNGKDETWTKDGTFGGPLVCGKEGYKMSRGSYVKDGHGNKIESYICSDRKPMEYYALVDKEGKVHKTCYPEDKKKLQAEKKKGLKIVLKKYEGCPRWKNNLDFED